MSYLVNIGTTDTELRGIKPYLRHVKISPDQLIEMMKLYTESELRHDAYILGGNYEDFIVTYFGNIKKFIELASNGYWEEHS